MSPEQAEGKPLDHRTDIFSLGVVLYELATGERPFKGDSPAAVMGSILRDRPTPVFELRPDLPRHLDRIVSACLEKQPDDRFQSSRDVYNGLRQLRQEVTSEPARTLSGAGAERSPTIPISMAGDRHWCRRGLRSWHSPPGGPPRTELPRRPSPRESSLSAK